MRSPPLPTSQMKVGLAFFQCLIRTQTQQPLEVLEGPEALGFTDEWVLPIPKPMWAQG